MVDSTFLFKLVFTFAAAFVAIRLLVRYAPALGLVDVPNERSHHKQVTPRGAGIGIMAGVIFADLLVWNDMILTHAQTLIAIFLVFVVGVLDDHRDTTPKTKFLVIFAAVLLLYSDGIVIDSLGTLFGVDLPLGWLALPFTMFAVAGFTNALNLSDGLDGLAGSLSLVILGTLALIGYENGDEFIVSIALSFMAAITAFLWFNWNPAKIFMGDSGSLTLGFVIAVLSIKALAYIQPVSILFIAALPILDTVTVMVRRKRSGRSIFAPDKLHLHHILLQFFNGNVRRTVSWMALLQTGFSVTGIALAESSQQRYTLILFVIMLAIFYILLSDMIARQNKFAYHRKKRRKR